MKYNFTEAVYMTLTGDLCEENRVPGVENLYAEGAPCDRLYREMWDAYLRLLDRLGCKDEDPDVDIIIDSLLRICEIVGHGMYRCGEKFAGQEKSSCAK